MVAGGGETVVEQILADLLHRRAGGAVDDAASVPAQSQNVPQIGLAALRAHHFKIEIGPVKAGDNSLRRMQFQQLYDVIPHHRGSGGRKGAHRGTGRKCLQKLRDFQIAGPEILPPLGDTVGLIHRHKGQANGLHQPQKSIVGQPLGGDIEELYLSPGGAAKDLPVFLKTHGGVEALRRHPRLPQCGHLILHQGNQRRDHQRQSRQKQGRNLVAHGLTRTGGHDPEGIPARKQSIDHGLLPRTEGIVAEILF